MIFLNIYIAFSILTFATALMQSYVLSKQLKRKYPDVVAEYCKKNKSGILEKTFEYIRTFICCFVPIINIAIFYVSLFKLEMAEEKFLNKMLNK